MYSNNPKVLVGELLMYFAAPRYKESRTRLKKLAAFNFKSSERKCHPSWVNAFRSLL